MSTRKNYGAKIMSFLALFAIVVGIVGTTLSFLFSSPASQEQKELTQSELEQLIQSLSGATASSTGVTASGTISESAE